MQKLTDYEICVHVFGGTSFPGCCNYALPRTALANVSSYSKATNTFPRNFYVDNVLKSVPSVRDALLLIQEVIDLCKRDGFNRACQIAQTVTSMHAMCMQRGYCVHKIMCR